jgi:hypothetical protein
LTLDPATFRQFIRTKNEITAATQVHYAKIAYRNMRLRSHIHIRKSEDRLIRTISKVFGQNCLIFYGNWSRNPNMKFGPPIPGMGLKRLLAKYFYLASVDEYNSSCICYVNQARLENKTIIVDKKAKKIHRCLVCNECCDSEKSCKIQRFINRDINGARNILAIGSSELANHGRPQAYTRTNLQKDHGEDPFGEAFRAIPNIPPNPPVKRVIKVV